MSEKLYVFDRILCSAEHFRYALVRMLYITSELMHVYDQSRCALRPFEFALDVILFLVDHLQYVPDRKLMDLNQLLPVSYRVRLEAADILYVPDDSPFVGAELLLVSNAA